MRVGQERRLDFVHFEDRRLVAANQLRAVSGQLERHEERFAAAGGPDIGALNPYSPEPREWSDTDIAVAGVLVDVATSYVVNVSKLRQQEQLSGQLQEVLESWVVIEQV